MDLGAEHLRPGRQRSADGLLLAGGVINPYQVTGIPTPATIAAGFDSAMMVGTDGSVWGWGENLHGILGVIPVQVPGLSGVSQVSADLFYSLAVHTIGFILR